MRTPMTLVAEAATAQAMDDTESFVVAFAEHSDSSEASLAVMVPLNGYDEQDRALNMDTYCIVVDAGPTCYGGIEECVLEGSELSLRLTVDAANHLGVASEIAVSFAGGVSKQKEIEDGLRRVFGLAKEPVRFLVRS